MSTIGSIETGHLRDQQIEKGGKWAHWDASRRDAGAKESQEEEVQAVEQQKYQEQRDHMLLVFLFRLSHRRRISLLRRSNW